MNETPCPPPNPKVSICDDFLSFDVSGLAPVAFIDSTRTQKVVVFGLLPGAGATVIGNQVFTEEGSISSINITAQILAVDAPQTLLLFGLGLLMLGYGVRRQQQKL